MNEQTSTTQAKGVKVMKLRLIATIVTGATAAMLASAAFGQANPQNSGYVLFGYGTPDNNIWRSGSYGGKPGVNDTLCWRTGYWTPAMAIVECDPDLVPKPPAPPPAVAAASLRHRPAPAPAPAPAPTVQKITLAAKALFDFDKAVLKPEGKAAIDSEVISKLKDVTQARAGPGHRPYRSVSARRPTTRNCRSAVPTRCATIWSAKGVARDKIETLGMGKTQPIPGRSLQSEDTEGTDCLPAHRIAASKSKSRARRAKR